MQPGTASVGADQGATQELPMGLSKIGRGGGDGTGTGHYGGPR